MCRRLLVCGCLVYALGAKVSLTRRRRKVALSDVNLAVAQTIGR